VPCDSVVAALEALRTGDLDGAMVPIENSVEGGVSATLDALSVGSDVVITAEVLVPVTFVVAVRPGTRLADVRAVGTHPHGWAQVRRWTHANLPAAAYVSTLSTAAAAAFYRSVLDADVIEVANSETAEFVKLAETTYRDVNIALANEMARAGERLGVDALQAFELANTQPFSHIHAPGAGVGGHCIPVYPKLLMSRAPELRIPALSREINDEMPAVMVDLLDAELGGLAGRTVAVLGLSFRGDVKEATLSPAWPVLERLRAAGASVRLHDPWFTDEELAATGAEPAQGDPVADGTILLAKHAPFRELDYSRGGAIIDGRPGGWVPATAPGQRLHVIGRGWSAGG